MLPSLGSVDPGGGEQQQLMVKVGLRTQPMGSHPLGYEPVPGGYSWEQVTAAESEVPRSVRLS
jgi:hypothetical protein